MVVMVPRLLPQRRLRGFFWMRVGARCVCDAALNEEVMRICDTCVQRRSRHNSIHPVLGVCRPGAQSCLRLDVRHAPSLP